MMSRASERHEASPYHSQERWERGDTSDREGDEHDGREPECNDEGAPGADDREPSFGWNDEEAARGR
jgi:hypothetical protein